MIDFPISLNPNGDDKQNIITQYLQERNELTNAQELSSFVYRWKSIFQLSKNFNDSPHLDELITENFDLDEVWDKISNGCGVLMSVSSFILLPPVLLHTFLISNKYSVPIDSTFIQINQLNHLW